ncbi:MAG: ATP-dependent 6-phosphofructokinase [Holosporales bacterium]|jgi:6-phosphofructokinase 1|nr:ATP-dependent 6-phosphofructokinase [Holosporales bacterium]
MKKKKIGILTNGGDCSGLNSVIRGASIRAKILGHELIGIKRGLKGMIEPTKDIVSMVGNVYSEESLLTRSGSILLSNTKPARKDENSFYSIKEGAVAAAQAYKELCLDGLIYIGGDGSLSVVDLILSENKDVNIIAIPKTIDNDVDRTDISIGFTTAVEIVSSAIENIRTTAISHERVMVIEVMGRDAGFIALYSGIATGVDVILMPEFRFNIEQLINKVKECYTSHKNHCLIVVSEAVESETLKHSKAETDPYFVKTQYNGIGEHISLILKNYGFDSRAVVLGHTQRGGKTSILDRIIGSGFGVEAINAVDNDEKNLMLAYKNNKILKLPIKDIVITLTRQVSVDHLYVNIAKNLGIYIGEI